MTPTPPPRGSQPAPETGWWQASDGNWYPPEVRPAPPDHDPRPAPPMGTTQRASNGMAVAALVLGIVGVFAGLIPILFFVAFPCGVLAIIFGAAGRKRANQGAAGGGMSIAGLICGVLAVILAIIGIVIVNDAFEDLDDELNRGEDSMQVA